MRFTLSFVGLVVFLALSMHGLSGGEPFRIKAFGTVECKSKSKQTKEEESAALLALKKAILVEFINEIAEPRKSALNAKAPQLFASADDYLSQVTVLDSKFDKVTKTYVLVGQADVDPGKFDKLIDQASANVKKDSTDSNISWIFVARRQSSVKEIGAKVASGGSRFKSEESATAASAHSENLAGSSSSKSQEATVSESAVTKTADAIIYTLEDNKKASIDAAMSKVLLDRGFDVVPASELVSASSGAFNPDKIQGDFETSSQFSLEHQQVATKVCRDIGMPFLAFGTLTIGLKESDASTGMTRVFVIVDAQVLDCRKKFAVKAASIGALQVSALGANQTEAETLALQSACEKAASIIADQLRQRLNR